MKKRKYGIRNLSVGVCSVLLGVVVIHSNENVLAVENNVTQGEIKNEFHVPSDDEKQQENPKESEQSYSTVDQQEPSSLNKEDKIVKKFDEITQDIILENQKIARYFEIKDGKVRTTKIENKLSDNKDNLIFDESSKEFILQFEEQNSEKRPEVPEYTPYAKNKNEWTINANSQAEAGESEGDVSLAKDNNLNTIWHSNYMSTGKGEPHKLPAYAEIEFSTPTNVQTFIYIPRQNGENGLVKEYKIYIKRQNDADYTEVKNGEIADNSKTIKFIDLENVFENVKAIKFEVLTSQNGLPYAAASEFDVSDKHVSELQAERDKTLSTYKKNLDQYLSNYQISLKDLELAENGIERVKTDDNETIKFKFKPYQYNGIPVSIKYIIDLKNDSAFTQSHLVFSVPEANRNNLKIDSIDLQSYKVKTVDTVHDFSEQKAISEMAGFKGFYAGLGQPVYINSFYTGSEFPVALNKFIESENKIVSRYYSGKTLSEIGTDENGNVKTWNTVIGVARSNDYQVVQQDFYDYISKIGQDTYFRKQYNSWFDHMLNITAENIQSSFNEIERGFVKGGVSPLDSYVVDDGWQDMTTLWDFNRKFPNKLYDSSKQVKRFGSDFGLWLGPQGGYSQPGYLANHLVQQNLASKHAGVVYIGDKRYTEALDKLFTNYEKQFDINYWKLDGLLLNPRPDTDPNGNFVGGGYQNMYSMTEAHERWIKLYETIRRESTEPNKMWINLTSYIPPSPWFLQWVNSIWMQNAADVDYQDHVKKGKYVNLDFGNDANEAITYRDDRYEELVNLRRWQLPFANIYNHDPVYGNTANSGKKLSPTAKEQRPKINFSAEDLRTYLFMLGTRGTGFWEFYYSSNMMDDEKWQVNGEVVNWIEKNYNTLKHAKFHGGKPGHGQVYGYSAWDENAGILSIRNPIDKEQEYTIKLDRLVGVREGTKGMFRTTVHGDVRHNTNETTDYGDTLTIKLKPYETVIFQYSPKPDTKSANLLVTTAHNNTINLEFDEHVLIDKATFKVANYNVLNAVLNKDLRTVTLTLDKDIGDREVVTVSYDNVFDNAGKPNVSKGEVFATNYANGIIESLSQIDPNSPLKHTGIEGKGNFSITVEATLDELNQTIAEQEGQWKLSVDENGKIIFKVKDLEVKSSPFNKLKSDDQGNPDKIIGIGEKFVVTGVREKNGSLKIYIDGILHNTAYDKTKINETLEKAVLRVASPEFKGKVSRFILENKARDFETVREIFEKIVPQLKYKQLETVSAQSTSFDENDGGSRPATSAIDSNLESYWVSNPSEDNTINPQRLSIELSEIETVTNVIYAPRQVDNAVGNIKRAYLEYSEDGNVWNRVDFVNGNEDNTFTMLEGIKFTNMEFKPVKAKFFRITALETHHWNEKLQNKVVAVSELIPVLKFMSEKEETLTLSYLRDLLYEIASMNLDNYTTESLMMFEKVLSKAKLVYANAKSQEDINKANTDLKTAIKQLVLKTDANSNNRSDSEISEIKSDEKTSTTNSNIKDQSIENKTSEIKSDVQTSTTNLNIKDQPIENKTIEESKKVNLPKTGKVSSVLQVVMGMFVLLGSIGLAIFNKKKY